MVSFPFSVYIIQILGKHHYSGEYFRYTVLPSKFIDLFIIDKVLKID